MSLERSAEASVALARSLYCCQRAMQSHCRLRAPVECCTVFYRQELTPRQGHERVKESRTMSLAALGRGCASPSRVGEGKGKGSRGEPEDMLQSCWEPPLQDPSLLPVAHAERALQPEACG